MTTRSERLAARAARRARAGFTLIELLAVMLILGLLMTFLIPRITEAVDQAKVTACRKNLLDIYANLMIYDQKFDDIPQKSGVRFFADLVGRKVLEATKSTSKKLTCPGVKASALEGLRGLPLDEWYKDQERIDGQFSAYAGRDMDHYPLKKFPGSGKEPLVADDNDGGEPNHTTTTLVLYADGSVNAYEQALLEEDGTLQEDEYLLVGPESQVEELRKLSLD